MGVHYKSKLLFISFAKIQGHLLWNDQFLMERTQDPIPNKWNRRCHCKTRWDCTETVRTKRKGSFETTQCVRRKNYTSHMSARQGYSYFTQISLLKKKNNIGRYFKAIDQSLAKNNKFAKDTHHLPKTANTNPITWVLLYI